MAVLEIDELDSQSERNLVGPVMRSGALAEAVIDAVEEDNPGSDVIVVDRDAYLRIHVEGECILRRDTLVKHLGKPFQLHQLEVEMSSFSGRLHTRTDAFRWFYATD